MAKSEAAARVLVVDDTPSVARAYARFFSRLGLSVELAFDGRDALDRMDELHFDVVVSDIAMPGVDGLALLRQIRLIDLDLPVILVTGQPSINYAVAANAEGAYRYLVKPVSMEELAKVVDHAVKVYRLASTRRGALQSTGVLRHPIGDRAGLLARFDLALDRLFMVYQPLLRWPEGDVVAFEALVRSEEPALPHPAALLDAAMRLGRSADLGRRIRSMAPIPLYGDSGEQLLFVNVLLEDLEDDTLFDSRTMFSSMARRIVLDVSERDFLHRIPDVRGRIARLRELGFRIALDDLGAGYAGLDGFAKLEPDFVKLDRSLISNLHVEGTKRRLVRSTLEVCEELGIAVVAEGVELSEERDTLTDLGCTLMQGHLFARPDRAPTTPK